MERNKLSRKMEKFKPKKMKPSNRKKKKLK